MKKITACLIIIGNEILSGRTQDKNIAFIAKNLTDIGISLTEVRVIPDHEPTIIDTVNYCRAMFDYIFTTGGIGPTHDDISSGCIAKCFSVPLIRNKEAEKILLAHYGAENLNSARLKMAEIPDGARLIYNPVSAAPGFIIGNVYVMAGVPRVMQAMFDGIKSELRGGDKVLSRTISIYVTEGVIADWLTSLQNQFPDVEIGSYPFIRNQRLGTSLVCRSGNIESLSNCYEKLKSFLLTLTSELEEGEMAD